MDNRTPRTQEFAAQVDRGLVAAVPVPFDRYGSIHGAAQECYVRYMAEQPLAGVAVWVHTGRGLFLTREQRRAVLESWRSGLPRHMVVVAGAGAPAKLASDPERYLAASLEMAEDAASGGADALLVHPPRVPDALAFHARLAEAGLPLLLFYLYEAAGGVSYSDGLLRELLAQPAVAGIKMATLDSVIRYQEVARIMQEFPERLLVTGEDRFFGYSFMRGARAALVGLGAACCGLLAGMMKAWFARDAAAFLQFSKQVDLLAETTFVAPMEGYIQRMLLVLAEEAILPEAATFDPWGPALDHAAERAHIRAMLSHLTLA